LPILLSFSFVFAGFSCDDALVDKQRFFSQNLTFSGEFEPNCNDSILGLKEAQILLSAAQKIRAESLACVGNLATKNLNEFKFKILKASYAPEIYAKELESSDEYEKLVSQNRARLRFWGHQSLSNFTVFRDFNKEGAVLKATQAQSDATEAAVREKPDEYFWFHKRFKHFNEEIYKC